MSRTGDAPEASMEDILASIRKIITDDGGEARAKPATIRPVPKVVPARPSNDLERALAEASAAPQGAVPDDDILELPAGPAVVAAKPVAVPPPRPVLVVAPKAVPLAPMLVAEKPNVSLQPVLVKPLNSVVAVVPSNPNLQPQRISANPVPLAKPRMVPPVVFAAPVVAAPVVVPPPVLVAPEVHSEDSEEILTAGELSAQPALEILDEGDEDVISLGSLDLGSLDLNRTAGPMAEATADPEVEHALDMIDGGPVAVVASEEAVVDSGMAARMPAIIHEDIAPVEDVLSDPDAVGQEAVVPESAAPPVGFIQLNAAGGSAAAEAAPLAATAAGALAEHLHTIDDELADLVKPMLRPMIQEWLDANMPRILAKALKE